MRRTVRALLAAVVTAPVLVAAVPPSPALADAEDCPQVLVISARGSGVAYGARGPAQLAAEAVVRQAQVGGRTARHHELTAEEYRAGAVWRLYLEGAVDGSRTRGQAYARSAATGTEAALKHLEGTWTRCGEKTRTVLVGYSQGAHAVGDAAERTGPGARSALAAVVLLADPRRRQGAPVNAGEASGRGGVGESLGIALRDVPADLAQRTRSYCVAGDSVCASPSRRYSEASIVGAATTHTTYGRHASPAFELTRQAEVFAVERLGVPTRPALGLGGYYKVVAEPAPGTRRWRIDGAGRAQPMSAVEALCMDAPADTALVTALYPPASPARCSLTQLQGLAQRQVLVAPSGRAWYDDGRLLHWTVGAVNRTCLELRWGRVQAVDAGYDRLLDDWGARQGAWATGCGSSMGGRLIRHPAGDSHYVGSNGRRYWMPDQATTLCRTGEGRPVHETSDRDFINGMTYGGWDKCPSARMEQVLKGKVLRHEAGDAHLVDAAGDRHWISDVLTWECLTRDPARVVQAKRRDIVTDLDERDWAVCDDAGWLRQRLAGKVLRHESGQAWHVDGTGVRRPIPDGGTYQCITGAGVPVVQTRVLGNAALLPVGTAAHCPGTAPHEWRGKVLRHSAGDAHWIDGNGHRHHVPDTVTWDCRMAMGAQVVHTGDRGAVNGIREGEWDDCPDNAVLRRVVAGKILRHSDGDAYYVDRDGIRHWVPDGITYQCDVQRYGVQVVTTVRRDNINDVPEGRWDNCGDLGWVRNYVKGKILRHSDGDAHMVDSGGTRHWIPDGGTYNCLVGKGWKVEHTRMRHYVTSIPEGARATC